jgi:hypothetical protein
MVNSSRYGESLWGIWRKEIASPDWLSPQTQAVKRLIPTPPGHGELDYITS